MLRGLRFCTRNARHVMRPRRARRQLRDRVFLRVLRLIKDARLSQTPWRVAPTSLGRVRNTNLPRAAYLFNLRFLHRLSMLSSFTLFTSFLNTLSVRSAVRRACVYNYASYSRRPRRFFMRLGLLVVVQAATRATVHQALVGGRYLNGRARLFRSWFRYR